MVTDKIERIQKSVENYFNQNAKTYIDNKDVVDWERNHIINIGTSILCTKWGVGPDGGSFVQSVADNDLKGAVSYADSVNKHAIQFYVMMMENIDYVE